ncbi:MAG: TetR/AcrR family transcriptional regulator [Flavobacteriaceae bacterium]|nr:TetR/AcrR family transcriptional regulator [Flavobacteriaceae bacterium]
MKYENRKDEIIQTAALLFKEKGYSAVTMRDIAKAVGVRAASLYNHIKSKQEILSEIIIALAEQFTCGMNVIQDAEISSVEKLKRIVKLHVDITANNQNGMASLNNDWMHLEADLDYYLRLRKDYENDFRTILNEGIAKGELINFDSEVMLFSILSTLRLLYGWIPRREELNPNYLADKLSGVLLEGVIR